MGIQLIINTMKAAVKTAIFKKLKAISTLIHKEIRFPGLLTYPD